MTNKHHLSVLSLALNLTFSIHLILDSQKSTARGKNSLNGHDQPNVNYPGDFEYHASSRHNTPIFHIQRLLLFSSYASLYCDVVLIQVIHSNEQWFRLR